MTAAVPVAAAPTASRWLVDWLVEFTVLGVPHGQGAIRSYGTGRPSVHANARDLLPWRERVHWTARQAAQCRLVQSGWPLTGPVAVSLVFTLPKPASAPKRRRTWPTGRRSKDLDHLCRAAADSLTGVLFDDDAQIVHAILVKTYPAEHPEALDQPGLRAAVGVVLP